MGMTKEEFLAYRREQRCAATREEIIADVAAMTKLSVERVTEIAAIYADGRFEEGDALIRQALGLDP